MKLQEMARRPSIAGKAKIQFVNWTSFHDDFPKREKETIVLTNHPESEFFHLKGGRQFLFRERMETSPNGHWRTWFGGTDQEPFLVQLREPAFSAFQLDGQDGFFRSLIPEDIVFLVIKHHTFYKRQGDIFATPYSSLWGTIYNKGANLDVWHAYTPKTPASILGTRHHLTKGSVLEQNVFFESSTPLMIVEGTIEAPDHAPMILETPHIVSQTRNLTDSHRAD